LKAVLAALCAWIAAPALCVASDMTPAAADDGAWIEAQRTQWQIPGVAVAIVDGERPPQTFAAGLCDVEEARACHARSQFAIASNTKFATGLLAAVLAEKGMLQLDTPLAEAWPELMLGDARTQQLTLLDLLSQRSGLGSVDWPYLWDPDLRRDDYLARLRHVPPVAPPRERWHYANANYVLAGAWIERVTGCDWRRLLRAHLLRPLRMKDAGFGLPADGTRGYTRSGNAITPAVAWTAEALAPAGSLVLSARDWTRLLAAVVGPAHAGRPALSPRVIETALTPQIANEHDPRFMDGPGGYALGLFSGRYHGNAIRYHIGRTTGFTSAVLLLPQRGLAIAVMTNVDNTQFPAALAFALADRRRARSGDETMRVWHALRGESSAQAGRQAVRDPPAPPSAAYAGRYTHPAWGTFEIAPTADGLRIRMDRLDAPLRRLGPNRFAFDAASGWPPMRLSFSADADDRVDGFLLEESTSPQPMRFDRVQDRAVGDTDSTIQ
jgi:CubicO group peptidase (beta-lactamase class C family)